MDIKKPRKELILPGVTLSVINTDKFKSEYLSFTFATQIAKDEVSKNALVCDVLARGSRDYPETLQLSRALDTLYGASVSTKIGRVGDIQIFGLGASFLSGRFTPDNEDVLGEVISVLASLITSPQIDGGAFRADHFETEKKNHINALRSRINEKRIYAVDRLKEELMRGTPGAISELGSVEGIEKITAADLADSYLETLKSSLIEIYYLGREPLEVVAEKTVCAFSSLDRSRYGNIPLTNTILPQRNEPLRRVEEVQPVQQGKLGLGFSTGISLDNPLSTALAVMNEIYGGSPTSKLFMNVREKSSLCYYCSSSINSTNGTMIVSSGIKNENYARAEGEILFWLDEIKAGRFTDRELDSARLALIDAFGSLYDSPPDLFRFYQVRSLLGIETVIENSIERIKNVSREDVVAAANEVKLDTVFFMKGENG